MTESTSTTSTARHTLAEMFLRVEANEASLDDLVEFVGAAYMEAIRSAGASEEIIQAVRRDVDEQWEPRDEEKTAFEMAFPLMAKLGVTPAEFNAWLRS